jgi:hypothetical protein
MFARGSDRVNGPEFLLRSPQPRDLHCVDPLDFVVGQRQGECGDFCG